MVQVLANCTQGPGFTPHMANKINKFKKQLGCMPVDLVTEAEMGLEISLDNIQCVLISKKKNHKIIRFFELI